MHSFLTSKLLGHTCCDLVSFWTLEHKVCPPLVVSFTLQSNSSPPNLCKITFIFTYWIFSPRICIWEQVSAKNAIWGNTHSQSISDLQECQLIGFARISVRQMRRIGNYNEEHLGSLHKGWLCLDKSLLSCTEVHPKADMDWKGKRRF